MNDFIFVPTPMNQVEALLDAVKLKPGESLLDVGSGDGRILIAAAKRGAKVSGYENNIDRFNQSRQLILESGVNAEITLIDFFIADWSGFDVITVYLENVYTHSIIEKFASNTDPHCRLILYLGIPLNELSGLVEPGTFLIIKHP